MSKPLISDAAMRGMYRTIERLRNARRQPGFAAELSRSARAALRDEPEAVLAALLSQLHRRDTILTEGDDPLLEIAAAEWFQADASPAMHAIHATTEECAAVAAGMALRIADKSHPANTADGTRNAPRPVVIALLRSFPRLEAVLQLIQQQDLAVVLYVNGAAEPRADAQRRQASTGVPIMLVDSSDAVAVCRVTQECLLRARNGWGGAVIHVAAMPGSSDALQLQRRHLVRRGLLEDHTPADG